MGWWSSKVKGQFWGEFEASHYNQRRLSWIIVQEWRALHKLLWGLVSLTTCFHLLICFWFTSAEACLCFQTCTCVNTYIARGYCVIILWHCICLNVSVSVCLRPFFRLFNYSIILMIITSCCVLYWLGLEFNVSFLYVSFVRTFIFLSWF